MLLYCCCWFKNNTYYSVNNYSLVLAIFGIHFETLFSEHNVMQ